MQVQRFDINLIELKLLLSSQKLPSFPIIARVLNKLELQWLIANQQKKIDSTSPPSHLYDVWTPSLLKIFNAFLKAIHYGDQGGPYKQLKKWNFKILKNGTISEIRPSVLNSQLTS